MGWLLLLLMASGLVAYYLFVDFRGLSHPEGMEQAQIARELKRGHGFTTQTLVPLALAAASESRGQARAAAFPDTYFAPLNPALNAALIKMAGEDYPVGFKQRIYFLDRVIAAGAMLLLFVSAGLTYLLGTRLFDEKIGFVSTLVVLLCDLLWRFSQSGLSQMLLLTLFLAGLLALEAAMRGWEGGRLPWLSLLAAGICFAALPLTHPLAICLSLGAIAVVVVYFWRAFLIPSVFILMVLTPVTAWLLRNALVSGQPFGTYACQLFGGADETGASALLRRFASTSEVMKGPIDPRAAVKSILEQFQSLFGHLGSVVVAPLFFLSLLHPFRRRVTAHFRWGILFMWGGAVLAMGLVGVAGNPDSANQLHVVFVPVMSIYGLAYLAVQWHRLGFGGNRFSPWRHAHFAGALLVSAMPLLLPLPSRVIHGLQFRGLLMQWPPYDPAAIHQLAKWTSRSEVIYTDIPWAVAWYADRRSVWLPVTPEEFQKVADLCDAEGLSTAGIYLTPESLDSRLATDIMDGEYSAWSKLMLRGQVGRFGVDLLAKGSPFPHWVSLSPSSRHQAWFMSDRPRWEEASSASVP